MFRTLEREAIPGRGNPEYQSLPLLSLFIIASFCDMVWRVPMVYPADKDMGALLIPLYKSIIKVA